MIVSLIVPITLSALLVLSHNLKMDEKVMDETALIQLRRMLVCAYEKEVYPDHITFLYQERECTLSKVNNNLIVQPGTLIFLNDIDTCFFYTVDNLIMMSYEKEEKLYESVLTIQ